MAYLEAGTGHRVGQTASHQDGAESFLSQEALAYLANSVSTNTVRALRANLTVFRKWGGSLPATVEEVANFLAVQAEQKKLATLQRYLASLHAWHVAHGQTSPARTETIRRLIAGIGRQSDTTPSSAPPLLLEDFKRILDAVSGQGLRASRNRALLALAYFGAFRRSEVVALRIEDLRISREGVLVTLRRSKANQTGAAETKAITRGPGGSPYCPGRLVETWLSERGSKDVPAPWGALSQRSTPTGIPKTTP